MENGNIPSSPEFLVVHVVLTTLAKGLRLHHLIWGYQARVSINANLVFHC